MDKDVRDALLEICDVLQQKVRFDMVKRGDPEMIAESKRLSTLLDEIINKWTL